MYRLCAVLCLVLCAASSILAKTVPATDVTTKTRACQFPLDSFPFCNTKLSVEDRVANIISLIQDEEIPPQLTARHGGGGSPGPASNISRIGLPEYDWGVNCIHGAQTSCVQLESGEVKCPTSFPNPVNYGMTFNDSLFFDLGRVIATELRALWLAGATEESPWSGIPHAGLDCWSPNININRDPRWGRNQEVPSEDPLVNGRFGTGYTVGLQTGEDKRFIKVVVTLKHWDAYSLEDADGFTRHNFNAVVSPYCLQNTYFPAFKESVMQGGAKGVMCSYNAVNGVPTCASPLLTNALRTQWGFDGYITSDTGAIEDIYQQHHYVATEAEAACVALVNGTCDVCSGKVYHDSLLQAVQQGLCSMDDVKESLTRTFKLRFELGLFDPIEDQPYWHVSPDVINSTEFQNINQLTTRSSMVLLKNDRNLLPLTKGSRIAVIGPHAKAQSALVGNYLGQLCPDDSLNCIVTPFTAIQLANIGGDTQTAEGCPINSNSTSGFHAATELARNSDVVVLVLGIDDSIEAEAHDRTSIDLPYIQHQLAEAVIAVGKPVVLVLINGGMLDISAEKDKVDAILEAGYPGMVGAAAIADTLFGDNDHLGGKLPYTIYPASYVNQISMSEMEMDVSVGRSYRFYVGTPVYPFGYGISLTTFALHNVSAPADPTLTTGAEPDTTLSYTVKVTNTGKRTGDEVVLAFFVPKQLPSQTDSRLLKQLFGYQRVHLHAGESQTVTFTVNSATLRLADKGTGNLVSTPGEFVLQFTNGVDQVLEHNLHVTGDEIVVEKFPVA